MLLRWFLTSQSGSESATATAKYILPHKMAEIFKWFKCSYNHLFLSRLNLKSFHPSCYSLATRTRHSWQSGGCLATCLAHVPADAPVAPGGHRNHLQCRHQRDSVSIVSGHEKVCVFLFGGLFVISGRKWQPVKRLFMVSPYLSEGLILFDTSHYDYPYYHYYQYYHYYYYYYYYCYFYYCWRQRGWWWWWWWWWWYWPKGSTLHFLQKYVVGFCLGMFLLVLRIEFSKGFWVWDICTKNINLFTFLCTRAHSKLTMNLGLTIVTMDFSQKRWVPRVDFFGGSVGWIWGLRKGAAACSAIAALAAVWKSGSAVVAQRSGLSFNYLGFPPKKKITYIYIYMYTLYM